MCLENYSNDFKFLRSKINLLSNISSRWPLDALKILYNKKHNIPLPSTTKAFAPYDLENHWADPFVGEMALYFHRFQSELTTINGTPNHWNAPIEVFHKKTSLQFRDFKKKLIEHFKTVNPPPIMIDDGTYALNIIGIGEQEHNIILWIADPHINANVNKETTDQNGHGLYTVTLNSEGTQIQCSINDEYNKYYTFGSATRKALQFQVKKWAALFPE